MEAIMSNLHPQNAIFDNQNKGQGSIIRKPGSQKLYVLLTYFGRRIEKSTSLNDTPENRKTVRKFLDRVIEDRDAGKLNFAKAFPGASDQEKAFFAQMEGWHYAPKASDVLFGDYVDKWYRTIWARWEDDCKKQDYKQIIDYWILPYFKDMTFFQINHSAIVEFIGTLKKKKGSQAGRPLSTRRIKNILVASVKLV